MEARAITATTRATRQTTQMTVGAMNETDRTIAILANSLYKKYELRRVYYSPFNPSRQNEENPCFGNGGATPKWRGRRLYQADRLIKLYGMSPDEILPESDPNLEFDIDPKAAFALRNRSIFPIEVNTADYEMLLRVPGIGIYSAKKIIEARKIRNLTHDILRHMKVSLLKSNYFITCSGKYNGGSMLDSEQLRSRMWSDESVLIQKYEQMSLFKPCMLPIDYDVST